MSLLFTDCECDMNGAKNSSCNPIGGQCYCKIGVMGRQCNQCQLGYFNLTDEGCQGNTSYFRLDIMLFLFLRVGSLEMTKKCQSLEK